MAYDDEERTERMMYSIPFRATTAEAREVYAKLLERPEWRTWSIADDLLRYGTFNAVSGQWLASDLADAYRAMARLTLQFVRELDG